LAANLGAFGWLYLLNYNLFHDFLA